MITNQTDS